MPTGFVSKGRKCPKGWKKKTIRVKGHGKRFLCKRRRR
jgi:hypothetical protein